MTIRRRERAIAGVTLVQVMVSAAVLAVVASGFASLVSNTAKGQKNVSLTADFVTLAQQVQLLLTNERACRVSLGGQDFDPTQEMPVELYFADAAGTGRGLLVAKEGEIVPGGLTLKRVRLNANLTPGACGTATPPDCFDVNLVITADKPANSFLGMPTLTREHILRIHLVGGKIDTCGQAIIAGGGGGPAVTGSCPPGMVMTGIDPSGTIKCASMPTGPAGPPGGGGGGGPTGPNCTTVYSTLSCPNNYPYLSNNPARRVLSYMCSFGSSPVYNPLTKNPAPGLPESWLDPGPIPPSIQNGATTCPLESAPPGHIEFSCCTAPQ